MERAAGPEAAIGTGTALAASLAEGLIKSPRPLMKKQAVKRHHHKHNLKHRYEFLETLGKGTYGKVKKARERSGKLVAIKSIRKDKIKDEQDLVHIRREIEIMSSLNHPHIIAVHEVFENSSKIVIVMEYASKGDLYDYISERQRLTEQEARHFFRQVVSAVYYCHKNGVVHRDLKLENILLDTNGNIKIADFGLSNIYQQDKLLQTYCGSPLYASPEIINGRPYKGPEVDSWSLGVLLYILVHGTMPFDGHDYKTLVKQITSGDYREPTKLSDACGLIRWMLMVNPERRATIEDIATHWWVNWGYKVPIGEQELLRESESPLATVAEWLRRSSRPLLENSSKVRCFLKQHIPGVALERQRSLKKSKKENDVSHALQEVALAPENPSKSILKRPKGILKKRNSCEQKVPGPGPPPAVPVGEARGEDGEVAAADLTQILSSGMLPCSTDVGAVPMAVPKKGILKKPPTRESGYYSSLECCESGDVLDAGSLDLDGNVFADNPSPEQGPQGLPTRRKGILKHNGKYSSSSTEPEGLPGQGFGSFSEVPLPQAPRARPSSAVSEDSILSTESFDQLDLPALVPHGGRGMRGCISADSLLRLEEEEEMEEGRRLRRWTVTHCRSPLRESSLSLAGCDNVTEVYRRAVAIGMKLS
ncbi:NUAK family SNF1-like kinase 2 [Falco rusticolus]|uniref:NUAK family SNF1-like kinase 2 n=1 Tax=Falco rusticolus TaxID=120794 RepID=UPI00188659CB|nr:NUAK family SNF1-like kinase 2 [Falco rusticolus]XP_055584371.1 NUAK family SNF1-like kinase 2 [Falco cherrug]XP_055675991.1 NUAK family SNF1-like kinase 2 [Falco peregrinus]